MLTTAQLMKSLGLQVGTLFRSNVRVSNTHQVIFSQAAGYNYVVIDDCWAEKNRTAEGNLIES